MGKSEGMKTPEKTNVDGRMIFEKSSRNWMQGCGLIDLVQHMGKSWVLVIAVIHLWFP